MLKVTGAELGKVVTLTGYALVRRAGGWVVLNENDRIAWKLNRRQAYLVERLAEDKAPLDEVRVLVDEESVTIIWDNARLYLYKGGHYAGDLVKVLKPKRLKNRVLFALNLIR